MQLQFRPVLRFFLAFFVLYTVLTAISLVPGVGAFANQCYRQATEPILKATLSKTYVQLKADPSDPDVIWVEYASKAVVQQQMAEANKAGKTVMDVTGRNSQFFFYNLFLVFYLLLVVLIVISPISWKSKLLRLLVGTVVFYFFTVFKMWLVLLKVFSQPEDPIYAFSGLSAAVVNGSQSILTIGVNLLVVLVLWGLLVFDRENWKKLVGQ